MAIYSDPMGELKGMIQDRFAAERKITEERLAREFEEINARLDEALEDSSGQREPDVRMAALHLAQHMVAAYDMIDFADDLAQFVLTGKKPGTEG